MANLAELMRKEKITTGPSDKRPRVNPPEGDDVDTSIEGDDEDEDTPKARKKKAAPKAAKRKAVIEDEDDEDEPAPKKRKAVIEDDEDEAPPPKKTRKPAAEPEAVGAEIVGRCIGASDLASGAVLVSIELPKGTRATLGKVRVIFS